MTTQRLKRSGVALSGAAMLVLAGCGGGSSTPAATSVDIATIVIDGAIENALVCVDSNVNGRCDTDEVQARTNAAGRATLTVPNADAGRYPLVAQVGLDAVDADTGPVPTAYTMSTPADRTGVISPLTTLVQQTVASTGASTAEAEEVVRQAAGLSNSLFEDFTKVSPATEASAFSAALARMLVVTTQRQSVAVKDTVGTLAIDGAPITQVDLDEAIQKKRLETLSALVKALSDPTLRAATSPTTPPADREAALQAAATTFAADFGLTPAAVATVVAVNHQNAASAPPTAVTPSAGSSLAVLDFDSTSNYFVRVLSASLAQATPDSSGSTRYVDRRARSVAGRVATWGSGGDPWRNADLNWNGSAWAACPINFENTATVRDAQGNGRYTYCDARETGNSSRAAFDIAGRTMAEVYEQIRSAGYTNVRITDPTVLGSATFPGGSQINFQTVTPLTEAISYYPAGVDSPPDVSNLVSQYGAGVSAGGDARNQAAGVGCNVSGAALGLSSSSTLEGMIASHPGNPCVYGAQTFVYGGATYTSDVPNEWWSATSLSLGQTGSVRLNTGTAPGYYSGNTKLRLAFTGSGTNPVTYYACKERFTDGSNRNCVPIGTGSYTITTLGDARVLTLSNPPLQAAALTYNRVFVERGGHVYYGYQAKPIVNSTARLNGVATDALLTRLGVRVEDPSVPLALTAASYQGTWDLRNATTPATSSNTTTVFINANGSVSCRDNDVGAAFACTVSITDPATGAFAYTDAEGTANGSFDFLAGTASGTYSDPTATPTDGNFVGGRR